MPILESIIVLSIAWCLTGCGNVYQAIVDVADQADELAYSWKQALGSITDPQTFAAWMDRNISYAEDRVDEADYRDPDQTASLGYGDCDDYAQMSKTWCDEHGIVAKIVEIHGPNNYAHAITVTFRETLGYFTNDRYVQTNYTNIEALVRYVKPDYTYWRYHD